MYFHTACNYLLFWPGDIASHNFWVQFRLQTLQNSFKGFRHQKQVKSTKVSVTQDTGKQSFTFPLCLVFRRMYGTGDWCGCLTCSPLPFSAAHDMNLQRTQLEENRNLFLRYRKSDCLKPLYKSKLQSMAMCTTHALSLSSHLS